MFEVNVKKVVTIVLISLVFVMITIVFSSKIILPVNSEMLTTYEQNNMKIKKVSDVVLTNNFIEIYYDKSSVIYNNLSKTLSGDDSKSTIDYLIDNKKKPKMYLKDNYKILEFNLNKDEIQKVFENISVDNDMIIRAIFDDENELGNEINFKLNREEIIRNNMVETARKEIGNTGEKYWTWYGFNRRVLWCCVFVSWVANENDVLGEPIPKFIWVKKGVDYYKERNALKYPSKYTPLPADLIFFDWNRNGIIDHVGLVEKVEKGYVYAIEGNASNKDVKRRKYKLNSPYIYAYGVPEY